MIRKILSSLLVLITPENLGKAMDSFNKGVQDFGKSMDSISRELSDDVRQTQEHQKRESIKNKKNLDKIFGDSNHIKIWSDKKSNTSLF